MSSVIKRLGELGLGVITMNTLGGGLIPQNEDYFSFLRQGCDTIAQDALSYVYAHPEITSMLSGMKTLEELSENIKPFEDCQDFEKKRTLYLNKLSFSRLTNFCTGCRYCDGCPKEINISELMLSYNLINLKTSPHYNRTEKRVIENIAICNMLKNVFHFLPFEPQNPCVACAKCEKACTQNLSIIKNLEDLYERFSESGFSKKAIIERVKELCLSEYSKIAFYPGGGYTEFVINTFRKVIPDLSANFFVFDRSSSKWGKNVCDILIRNPCKINEISPDIIIISTYEYSDEIFEQIKHYEEHGIKVRKLHRKNDVPWVFNGIIAPPK
jgi:ferredoxin